VSAESVRGEILDRALWSLELPRHLRELEMKLAGREIPRARLDELLQEIKAKPATYARAMREAAQSMLELADMIDPVTAGGRR
jgi:hypothetical protein